MIREYRVLLCQISQLVSYGIFHQQIMFTQKYSIQSFHILKYGLTDQNSVSLEIEDIIRLWLLMIRVYNEIFN